MQTQLTVAPAQCLSDRDPAMIVEKAKSAAADVVVFPEMFSNGYARFDPEDPAAIECWRKGDRAQMAISSGDSERQPKPIGCT